MASLEQLNRRTSILEQIVAKRLGLDPHEVIAGSIRSEVHADGSERVEWTSARGVERGFMASCWAEAERS